MTQVEMHNPTEFELEMIATLASMLKELGDFQIRSVELLSDELATLVVSVKTPPAFDTASSEMTKLHNLAQIISDEYSRNLVITTTRASEGGRKIAFSGVNVEEADNIVALNTNKVELPRRAAAYPPTEVRAESSPIYMLESACMAADEFLSRGHVEESRMITEKMSEVASELIKRGTLSLSDIDVEEICFEIAKLFVAHERRKDAELFLNLIGHDSDWIKEKLDLHSQKEVFKKSSKKIADDTKSLIADLELLL